MKKPKKLKINRVFEIDTSEYHEHNFGHEFECVENGYELYDAENITQYVTFFESEPIQISEIRGHLNVLENHGATHVSIDYHCDHECYEIVGFSIDEFTKSDSKKFNEHFKRVKADGKKKRIKKLKAELKELTGN